MAADLLAVLLKANLAAAAAILLVLVLRKPAQKAFGARVAYAFWFAPPLAVVASLLPARSVILQSASVDEPLVGLSAPLTETAPTMAHVDPVMGPSAVVALWLLGAAASFLLLAWRQSRFMKSLGEVTREGRFLRVTAAGAGPAVVGAIFPRIVLPADFEARYDATEQKVVLAHETAHVASGDTVINALLALANCIFWFNPLIHVAAHVIRVDQELACDAAVLSAYPDARRSYALALLKTQVAGATLPLGCYWPASASSTLKERITMLKIQTPSRARRLAGGAGMLTLCLGAGLGAWAAQPARTIWQPQAAAVIPTATTPAAAEVQLAQAAARPAMTVRPAPSATASSSPATTSGLAVSAEGRSFQRINSDRTGYSPSAAASLLTLVMPDGTLKTVVPDTRIDPTQPEQVRTAKALIAQAKQDYDARFARGAPPAHMTSELQSALRISAAYFADQQTKQLRAEIELIDFRLAQDSFWATQPPQARETFVARRATLDAQLKRYMAAL